PPGDRTRLDRHQDVTGFLPGPVVRIDHHAGLLDGHRVHLPGGGTELAAGSDGSAGPEIAPREDRPRRRGRAGDDVGSSDRRPAIGCQLHRNAEDTAHLSDELRGARRIPAHHPHLGQRQDLAQAEELLAGLPSRSKARDHARVRPRHVPGRHRGGGPGPDRGQERGLHQRERRPGLRIGQEVRSLNGGQSAPPIAFHDRRQLGAQRAERGQGGDHREEHAVTAHGQPGPRQGGNPAGRTLAEGALHGGDDIPGREQRRQVLAAEDEHQAGLRLIIRLTVASSTTSPRWFVTSWRYVTMPRSDFFVSRLSVMVTFTLRVSPWRTGATMRISLPRYDMPVPWMSPVCMIRPSERQNVMAPGAARPVNTDSLVTYSMSMNSGSLKPQRFTNAQMSASDTVRPSVRYTAPTVCSS